MHGSAEVLIGLYAFEFYNRRIRMIGSFTRTVMCEKTLEEEGVHGDITVADFNLDLIPLNNDIISMESSDSLREVSLNFSCLMFLDVTFVL